MAHDDIAIGSTNWGPAVKTIFNQLDISAAGPLADIPDPTDTDKLLFHDTDADEFYLNEGDSWTKVQEAATPAAVELAPLPNGDDVYTFDGVDDYLEAAADDDIFSIPFTRSFTFEVWLSPSRIDFTNQHDDGYVHFAGKGEPSKHEYVFRMYSFLTPGEDPQRPNRMSGYAVSNAGGFGQGTYFQQTVVPGEWIHFVVTYDMDEEHDADWPGIPRSYPGDTGRIRIYKNGQKINESWFSNYHGAHPEVTDEEHDAAYIAANDYVILSQNNTAPFRLGTRDGMPDSGYFCGRMAHAAIYSSELTPEQIAAHYDAMIAGDASYDDLVEDDSPAAYWPLSGVDPLADRIGYNDLEVGTGLDPGTNPSPVESTRWWINDDGSAYFGGNVAIGGNVLPEAVYLGGDIATRLYRTADGRLKTDSPFVSQQSITTYEGEISSGAGLSAAGPVAFDGSVAEPMLWVDNDNASGEGIWVRFGSGQSTHYAFKASLVGDSNARLTLDAAGKLRWGSGATSSDVDLYRSAADTLRTSDSLVVDGDLTVSGTFTAPDTSVIYGVAPTDVGFANWAYDPIAATGSTIFTAGRVYLISLYIRRAVTITKIGFGLNTAGASLTAGQCWAGLYNSAGTKVVDAAAETAMAAGTSYTQVTVASTALSAGRYLVALLANGTVPPTVLRGSSNAGSDTGNLGLAAANMRFALGPTGQTTLPGTVTLSSLAAGPSFWTGLVV